MIDYEAEYNNRAMVPEHPDIIAGWAKDAAAYREGSACELDCAYGLGPRMQYDLFLPTGGADARMIALFLHGGYWQALDRKHFSHMARGLNAQGYTVCVAGYDLCPEVRISDIVVEIRDLAAHLWERFRKPILAYGHSAGGHLTAALLATDWRKRHLPPGLANAGMAVSGLFDLLPLIRTGVNDAVRMDQKEAIANSPIAMGIPYGARLIASVGELESSEYKRQSRVIVDFWSRGGIDAKLRVEEGANHFTVIAPLADPDSGMIHDLAQLGR
ncbi:alpha/beta hydrolase [Breoghania sp.]|uniref:alpha/beta hydrolase n=1 Tax=Breoghania sp. TaxID=2065378 RepID=UPI002AA935E8|nr:alpha/beta hydrolase [Breoghania sp.]